VVSTLGGDPATAANRDGVGADARFASFDGLVVDDSFTIYSVDRTSTTVRRGVPQASTVPPIVARLASPHVIAPGSVVVLSATSTTAVSYQWRKTDVNIPGAAHR